VRSKLRLAAAQRHRRMRQAAMTSFMFIGLPAGAWQAGSRGDDGARPAGPETATIIFLAQDEVPSELVHRLRRGREASGDAAALPVVADEPILFDRLEIDIARRRARWAHHPLDLSGQELDLLALLAGRAGHALTFAELFARVWGLDYPVDATIAHSAVRRLRRKLAAAGAGVEIESVRGYGFRLVRQV